MSDLDLPKIFDLLSSAPGEKCWMVNLTKEPIDIGEGMTPVEPGQRLYLGSQQRLRAAAKLSRSTFEGIKSRKWVNVQAPTFAKLALLLQILHRNGCPLIDPEQSDRPIVFWDDEESAAWEKIAKLHNRKFNPYEGLPDTLAAYLSPQQALLLPVDNIAYLPSASWRIDTEQALSKYAQQLSGVVVSKEGMKFLQYLIAVDMKRRNVESLEEYAAVLVAEQSRVSTEEARKIPKCGALLAGLREILGEGRLPEDLDKTFVYLAATLRTVEGLPFGGNAVELLRYCGLFNGSNHLK